MIKITKELEVPGKWENRKAEEFLNSFLKEDEEWIKEKICSVKIISASEDACSMEIYWNQQPTDIERRKINYYWAILGQDGKIEHFVIKVRKIKAKKCITCGKSYADAENGVEECEFCTNYTYSYPEDEQQNK